jgi:hypothetical protein
VTLAEIQHRFLAALQQPLRGDRLARATPQTRAAAATVRPTAILSAADRLEIYARGYWFRLLDSFAEDFPGLRTVLGKRRFDKLARAYLADCPPNSFTLRDLGSRLETWLAAHPDFAGPDPELASDMIQLELAHIHAFDAPELPPLPEPAERIGLQPHLVLLELSHGVDEIRLRGRRRTGDSERARIHLAVHRQDSTVYYRRLEPAEHSLLTRLRDGIPLSRALRGIQADPATIQRYFETWARLGWLTTPSPCNP